MIGYLSGDVIKLADSVVLVVCGGVGYEVKLCAKHYNSVGSKGSFYTVLVHREDAMLLYGFPGREEKEAFKLITKAQGIGASIAMEVINSFSVSAFMLSVLNNDVKSLTAVPGLGKKKAEKLIFELKDKIEKIESTGAGGTVQTEGGSPTQGASKQDAVRALIVLGFSASEAASALSGIETQDTMSTEELIAAALKSLGGK